MPIRNIRLVSCLAPSFLVPSAFSLFLSNIFFFWGTLLAKKNVPRIFAMKMLYTKPSWSCQSMTDMLAPVAKMQLTGDKLVLALPYACLTAQLRAKSPGTPLTLGSLCQEMLSIRLAEFETAGGMGAYLKPGDFFWIPECCLVAEFSMWSDDISTSLSWVALTQFNCQSDNIKHSLASIDSILLNTCQPSQKTFEAHCQAWTCCV